MAVEARTLSTNKPPVFAREATGLVKNVTFWDAVTLNVANMSAGSALALIGYTMVLLPTVSGVNLVYGSMIAFVMSIPQIIVYSMMSRRMPRTGGDYVWLTRSIGGFLGGPLSLFGYALGNLPYLALTVLSAVFAIGSVGVALGNMGYLGLALPGNLAGAQPAYQFLIGAVIYAAIVGVNLLRPKGGYKLVAVLTTLGLAAWILSIVVLLSAGTTGVQNYINGLNIANTTYTSVASSYAGPSFDFGNTVGLLIPFFAFFPPALYWDRIATALSLITGFDLDVTKLKLIGERIVNLQRMFNVREGITRKDDTQPRRLLEEKSPSPGRAKGHVIYLKPMLDDYYRLRNWNNETGIPTNEKLKELSLEYTIPTAERMKTNFRNSS